MPKGEGKWQLQELPTRSVGKLGLMFAQYVERQWLLRLSATGKILASGIIDLRDARLLASSIERYGKRGLECLAGLMTTADQDEELLLQILALLHLGTFRGGKVRMREALEYVTKNRAATKAFQNEQVFQNEQQNSSKTNTLVEGEEDKKCE